MTHATDRLASALADRYRLERELGQGGMATVYLAQDLRHDRQVAIKVLRPELAAVLGADRFVQEIKTTAALQHPHILPLFDSGQAGGFLYYVMPYVEGETLRSKLDREKQLGIEEAVKITTEVADALDYAHRHGVIHRDIKPENILLHDGRPMVADFGIALAVSAAAGGRMTETGLSLGTPHYMSPEQATADRDITARSDVYSLASVLYEMLAGEPPHLGNSAQQIIMKIVTDVARPVTELRRSVPPNVAAAVGQALEKLPADRFESARAFAEALGSPAFRTAGMLMTGLAAPAGVRVLGRTVSWRAVAGVATAAAVLAVAGAGLAWLRAAGATRRTGPVVRAETSLLTPTDSGVIVFGLDIAPDGSAIVFAARPPGDTTYHLYLRRLDDRAARVIPGTEGAWDPRFSPDGRSIAFLHRSSGTIRVTPLEGVTIQAVASGAQMYGLSWGTDGYLYYDQDGGAGLTRVPARGGTPQVFLGSGDPETPDPLPDGRHVLYTECCSDTASVGIVDVETGEARLLDVRASRARYLDTGHLLLWSSTGLRAVAFDARRLALRGEPFTVLDSVSANGQVGELAVARNGTAAYIVWPGGGYQSTVAMVDLAGRVERLPLPAGQYYSLRFSPDGRRLAFGRWGSGDDTLTIYDLLLGSTTTLNAHGSTASMAWTPDGTHVVVARTSRADSQVALIAVPADGSGVPDTLANVRFPPIGAVYLMPGAFDPEGRRLLLTQFAGGKADLVVVNRDSQWTMTGYLTADWREFDGRVSPDGRWVVYASEEERSATVRARVYVRSFPEPGERFTVSDSAGDSPRWAPDGRTIYYWSGRTLVAVSVQTAPTFRVTGRRDLFTLPTAVTYTYDVNPNGRGFSIAMAAAGAAGDATFGPRLVLVANWLEEFRRKAAQNH